jgi:uncharacterized protein YecE (DUF72 family)
VIRVGPAGWSYADWEGVVYPRKKPRDFHPLAYLTRFVDCLELNSSFYAAPRADYAERWVELLKPTPGFRLPVKLEQVYTHQPLPDDSPAGDRELGRRASEFMAGVEPLRAAGVLSALLVQCPIGFRDTPGARRRLERLEGLFGHLRPVLEVRHRSWFERAPLAFVERLGWSLARIDLPASADHPPQDAPTLGPVGYLRLHGRNDDTWFDARAGRDQRYDYLYSTEQVKQLAATAERIASGHDETYVVTNNHFAGKAVANALELMHALDGRAHLAPVELIETYPRLSETTRPLGQPKLF